MLSHNIEITNYCDVTLYGWIVSSEHFGFLFLVFFITLFAFWFRAAD